MKQTNKRAKKERKKEREKERKNCQRKSLRYHDKIWHDEHDSVEVSLQERVGRNVHRENLLQTRIFEKTNNQFLVHVGLKPKG